jgi:hypothetical protein
MEDAKAQRLKDDQGLLTEFAEDEILKNAVALMCECPRHLLVLLKNIRSFQTYEQGCAETSEKDRVTHQWLYQESLEMDRMVSNTILELARREGMLDDHGKIVLHPAGKK